MKIKVESCTRYGMGNEYHEKYYYCHDICEMDAMIDMLIRAEEHLLGEMGKWKVKSINEEEYTRRTERLRRTL